jgi:hypothetical protein
MTDESFAKHKITGVSTGLERRANSLDGTVDVNLLIAVDLTPNAKAEQETFTIIDNNRRVAARLLVEEGEEDEQLFKFVLDTIKTECFGVDFLASPLNIDKESEFPDPTRYFTSG